MEGGAAEEHYFELRRAGTAANAPSVRVDFSPESASRLPQTPAFNSDALYFTPCFVLPSEQVLSSRSSPNQSGRATPTWRCTWLASRSCPRKRKNW